MENEDILKEIKIPNSIFYEKYSTLHLNRSLDLGLIYFINNGNFKILNNRKNFNLKNAIDYKNYQKRKLGRDFSWNEIKKIYTLEIYYGVNLFNGEINLLSEINKEIAKEEIDIFLKNIKKIFRFEKLYLVPYIKYVEQMFLYNENFKNTFLKSLEYLIVDDSKEISYFIRFFEQNESVKQIYNYIFKYTNGGIFKNYERKKIIATALFVSNLNNLDEEDKEFFLSNCLLTEQEEELLLREIELLEDKEAECE